MWISRQFRNSLFTFFFCRCAFEILPWSLIFCGNIFIATPPEMLQRRQMQIDCLSVELRKCKFILGRGGKIKRERDFFGCLRFQWGFRKSCRRKKKCSPFLDGKVRKKSNDQGVLWLDLIFSKCSGTCHNCFFVKLITSYHLKRHAKKIFKRQKLAACYLKA